MEVCGEMSAINAGAPKMKPINSEMRSDYYGKHFLNLTNPPPHELPTEENRNTKDYD
jgi:hypothetical protein